MASKRSFVINILESEMIEDINNIIRKHANITIQSSSYVYFDAQPTNADDLIPDITFFTLESDGKKSADEKLDILIDELKQLDTDYAIRDEDSGKLIEYIKFVGAFNIKFDNMEIIKAGTYEKIDKLKSFKTEFGLCKGYKPNFRPMESQSLEGRAIKPENIYLFFHSQEDLMKLKEMVYEKILEIDTDFEVEFRQFTGEDPTYKTKMSSHMEHLL